MHDPYNIAFDIDGVIANFHDVLQEEILQEHGVDINGQDKFHIDVPDMNSQDIFKLIIKLINEKGDDIKPYPGVIDILKDFHERSGESIHYVTARVGQNKRATEEWLEKNTGLPFVLQQCRGAEKCSLLYNDGVSHYIDDRFKTVNHVGKYIPYTFLMSRPWNTGRQPIPQVRRIYSLRDATEHYLNASGCIVRKEMR